MYGLQMGAAGEDSEGESRKPGGQLVQRWNGPMCQKEIWKREWTKDLK